MFTDIYYLYFVKYLQIFIIYISWNIYIYLLPIFREIFTDIYYLYFVNYLQIFIICISWNVYRYLLSIFREIFTDIYHLYFVKCLQIFIIYISWNVLVYIYVFTFPTLISFIIFKNYYFFEYMIYDISYIISISIISWLDYTGDSII